MELCGGTESVFIVSVPENSRKEVLERCTRLHLYLYKYLYVKRNRYVHTYVCVGVFLVF